MRNSEQHSEKGAAFWFLHRLSGAHELPQAGSPFPGGSFFQHRLSGGRELPQACSPLTGGRFFACIKRGISPPVDGGNVAAPRGVGKRVDTCGFYPLNSRFPLFLSLAQTRDRRPLRNRGTAEDFFYRRGAQCAPMSRAIRSAGYHTAAQTVYSAQARHICAAQLVYALLWTATTSLI